jgi:phosphoglycerate dehydrogenase-like enzyme
MKVHAKHGTVQEFLKENPVEGIEVVDDPKRCNYLISGRYTHSDYNLNLRGVIIPYTGHNGIDLNALRNDDLNLFVTPTRSRYVAEKAVSLTLALLGNTINYHQLLKEGNWSSRNSDERLPWTSIQGLSVGLFGFGRIGKHIYKMLSGFDCEFYTIRRGKKHDEKIKQVKNLTNLVQMCDVIIIAAPLNDETKDMITKPILSKMKKKFLINVGRGKIVNEEDLYDALSNKKIKGYASDVWYNYPKNKEVMLPSSYPIHQFDNVVLSNHSGGYTYNTNKEVNEDLLKMLIKLRDENFEDKLDLENLI